MRASSGATASHGVGWSLPDEGCWALPGGRGGQSAVMSPMRDVYSPGVPRRAVRWHTYGSQPNEPGLFAAQRRFINIHKYRMLHQERRAPRQRREWSGNAHGNVQRIVRTNAVAVQVQTRIGRTLRANAQNASPRCGMRLFRRSSEVARRGGAPLSLIWLVGRAGFEPATNGLKVRCSTN